MASQTQFLQKSWHFFALVFCLAVLAFCWQIEAGGNGKEKHFVGKVPPHQIKQNASERQGMKRYYFIFNAIRFRVSFKILIFKKTLRFIFVKILLWLHF